MIARSGQYSGGSGTNPSVLPRGETISQAPAVIAFVDRPQERENGHEGSRQAGSSFQTTMKFS
jgi:hypothetical protein